MCDFAPEATVMPFGQYKGLLVAEVCADHAYCEWLLQQPWPKEHGDIWVMVKYRYEIGVIFYPEKRMI